jgi:hypothetical protein
MSSSSIELGVLPFSLECGTIGPHLVSSTVFLVVLPFSIVLAAIGPGIGTPSIPRFILLVEVISALIKPAIDLLPRGCPIGEFELRCINGIFIFLAEPSP